MFTLIHCKLVSKFLARSIENVETCATLINMVLSLIGIWINNTHHSVNVITHLCFIFIGSLAELLLNCMDE